MCCLLKGTIPFPKSGAKVIEIFSICKISATK